MEGFTDRGLNDDNFGESKGISVRAFDAFPKTKQTYLKESTSNGGIFTILVSLACLILTYTEFARWWSGTTTHTFSVEQGVAHDMQMNLDIVVSMRCSDLHMNVQDASGDRILAGEMLKKENTDWEHWTGPNRRYRAEDWRDAQREQYTREEDVHEYLGKARSRKKFPSTPMSRKGKDSEACRIYGSLDGNKVQGDFHITARGHGYMEFGEHLDHGRFNFSHHINELSFGPYFPALNNPLDDSQSLTPYHFYKYQYYLSIVPTIYTDAPQKLSTAGKTHLLTSSDLPADVGKGSKAHQPASQHSSLTDNPHRSSKHSIFTNQYAVTEQSHQVPEALVPGIFFKYDIEPILLTVAEDWIGLFQLLARCVNVVAGVLMAGGWLVSMVDWAGDVAKRTRGRSGTGLLGKEGGQYSGNGEQNGHSKKNSYGGSFGGYGAYTDQSPYGTPDKRM